jgi:hypothetical protein
MFVLPPAHDACVLDTAQTAQAKVQALLDPFEQGYMCVNWGRLCSCKGCLVGTWVPSCLVAL